MERMVAQIFESIFSKVGESFLSKVVEQTADNAHNNVKNIKDFEVSLKTLEKKLKSLSAKASDVEEEIKNAELSGRKKRKREVEEWLEQVKSIEKEVVELGSQVDSQGFVMRLMDGGRAPKLNHEVDHLVEQSRNFGELVLDICGNRGEAFLANGMVGEAFNHNLERILQLLEGRKVSSIGIYGMGGVGKTTLAKHINNRLLQQPQRRVLWVTVSQEFTITSLQDKIARLLGVDLSDEDDEGKRAARLHSALSRMKNSVLILDDVWENIDMLKVGCHISVECCRLVITTRSLRVCRQIRCQEVIPVKKLGKDEAWKLFNETLGNEIALGPQVEEIAKSVAKLCDGLPLGIISVAGSMRGETSIHTWTNALAELKECVVGQDGEGEDEVFKVLKYSFDQLNRTHQSLRNEFNTLQLCFLYCSLYPEDYQILKEDLVRKFICEGLMDQRKSRRGQIHQGHSILDKLVNVCLLESGVIFEEYVKMHDLVRGMALKICEGKYMVRAGKYSLIEIPDEHEWTNGLEKVSLMMSGIKRIRDGISPNCPNLSTLILCGSLLDTIPDSFFSKMQRLSSLDLGETDITTLPDSICEMKCLKTLFLDYCYNLENMPYLGNLKALRELNLSYTAIEEVPQGIEELLNLKFLSMDVRTLKILPRGLLLKLGNLQHVKLPFHIQVPIEEIENLKQLEEFSGGVENVNDFNRFITSRVHDTCYRVGVGYIYTARYRYFELYNNELILREVNLKDEKVSGQGVVYLTIIQCQGLSICFVDDFSGLNNPTSLKRVSIESCGGIECILSSDQGQGGSLPPQISTLEEIKLVELEDLKGVVKKEEIGASVAPAEIMFSSLRRLVIHKCSKIGKLGLPVLGVPNLEYIEIEVCGELQEIFEDDERGSVTLSKLKKLSLLELPRLKCVCRAKLICKSIETIEIVQCPSLVKKLPLHLDVSPPPTLRVIVLAEEWWESLEWDSLNLPQLLHPFLQLF
ncbi:probable disease resistance protein At4g27220 [Salvia miltiorrhiza]|uniref:probable disease resistance protein At4g27220 n=1 Tax=Salvia miltiorrhiza TaxID=226208 RepID=UPI0025ABB4BE|nr:probable disease resistance protein At4g27220 [Salvia miltiorrhiza]